MYPSYLTTDNFNADGGGAGDGELADAEAEFLHRRVLLQDGGGDGFGHCLNELELAAADDLEDVLGDGGVVHRVLEVIGAAGLAEVERQLEVDQDLLEAPALG